VVKKEDGIDRGKDARPVGVGELFSTEALPPPHERGNLERKI